MNKKQILILGHTGFIGHALYKHFNLSHPDLDILGLSSNDINLEDTDDIKRLSTILQKDTCLIVCSFLKRQVGDNLDIFQRNMTMTKNLCQVLSHSHKVSRLVYMSSAAVYGEEIHNIQIDEDTAAQPTSYYGLAKFNAETMLQLTLANQDCSLVILRPPTIYGPGDQSTGYDPAGFLAKTLAGETITLWGDGSELRSFVYLNDLIKITESLISHSYQGILNVSSHISYSFRDIIDVLENSLKLPVNWQTQERSKMKVDHRFQIDKTREVLGDWPYIPLEKGLDIMYQMGQVNK